MTRRRSTNQPTEPSKPRTNGRRVWVPVVLGVSVCVLLAGVVWAFARPDRTPVYGYEVVNKYPHDRGAFTQGLTFDGDVFYEGTGRHGKSQLRRVELETGKVKRAIPLPQKFFGEGIAVLGDRIYQLTWKSGTGFIYDKKTLKRLGTFRYAGQGWGLTTDGRHLILSDGTPLIRYIDPNTFKEVARIRVTSQRRTVKDINELEYIGGEIFANIWKENRIARIAPATGQIVGWIDLNGLLALRHRRPLQDMHLNGIAYDAANDRLFVTGKNWPFMFQIKLIKKN
jgi:glutamine cyclotransferase